MAFATILRAFDGMLAVQEPFLRRPSDDETARVLQVPTLALLNYLGALCAARDRTVVLPFNKADVLTGAAMVSLLTQLRAMYLARSRNACAVEHGAHRHPGGGSLDPNVHLRVVVADGVWRCPMDGRSPRGAEPDAGHGIVQ